MKKFKILFIGGTWDENYNTSEDFPSGITSLYREDPETSNQSEITQHLNAYVTNEEKQRINAIHEKNMQLTTDYMRNDAYILGQSNPRDFSFHNNYGKASGLVTKILQTLRPFASVLYAINGGNYNELEHYIDIAKNYDIVFWWANVDNSLPKIRDVKAAAPCVMLITSKRNDNEKYTFQELIQKALASKSNLAFEFSKQPIENDTKVKLNGVYGANPDPELIKRITNETAENVLKPVFNVRVFDPLGCEWYNGTNLNEAVEHTMNRLEYLTSITRKKTTLVDADTKLIAEQNVTGSEENVIVIPNEQPFVDLVKAYAETFHEILKPAPNVKRFLGNCSMKPEPYKSTRCSKGMPSFRKNGLVFMSQRNVDKEYLTLENFVPTYLENDEIFYYGGKKPSVDTPIQLRLYGALPNINYMIHAHVYVKNAPFTTYPIPCGAIEEVDEVLKTIDSEYKSRDLDKFVLNLKGHGSLVMAKNVDDLKGLEYYGRSFPESFMK